MRESRRRAGSPSHCAAWGCVRGLRAPARSVFVERRGAKADSGTFPAPGILLVCPTVVPSEPVVELHLGFPGVRLKVSHRHYHFTRSYTENGAKLVTLVGGATSTLTGVKVNVTGTVASAGLLTGTVSVTTRRRSVHDGATSSSP